MRLPETAGAASRLRGLRARRGLRQKDLAEKLGMAWTTIANYEQGSRFPDEQTLDRIADYFAVSLDYLMGRSEVELPPEDVLRRRSLHFGQGGPLEPLSPLAREYLQALLRGDREGADRRVREALERGETIRSLYLDVFERSLKEVGRLWAEGELDVGTEHFFTASTQRIMSMLYSHLAARARPRNGRTCLVLAVCSELHEIGARMVSDLLEMEGWRSLFLGANLCNEDVLRMAVEHRPDLLALSATLVPHVDSVTRLIRSVRAVEPLRNVRILAGGLPFNLDAELWRRVGADGTGRNAAEAAAAAEGLLRR